MRVGPRTSWAARLASSCLACFHRHPRNRFSGCVTESRCFPRPLACATACPSTSSHTLGFLVMFLLKFPNQMPREFPTASLLWNSSGIASCPRIRSIRTEGSSQAVSLMNRTDDYVASHTRPHVCSRVPAGVAACGGSYVLCRAGASHALRLARRPPRSVAAAALCRLHAASRCVVGFGVFVRA